MDVYDQLTADINQKADKVKEEIEAFRMEILKKIEDARNNEILSSIRALGRRMDEFERRLPAPEETE